MRAAWVGLAIVLALVLQPRLERFAFRGIAAVDLVLVVVVCAALTAGPITGLLTGAAAGLAQDALSSGVIGIGGLANTVVGFLTGIISAQFIVTQPVPRFVVFLASTALHAVIYIGLYVVLALRPFASPVAGVAGQAVGNAVVGVLAFQLVELWPGAVARRRAQRARIRR